MNKFADLSGEEFAEKYLSKVQNVDAPHPPMCTPSSVAANSTMRASADWRTVSRKLFKTQIRQNLKTKLQIFKKISLLDFCVGFCVFCNRLVIMDYL